jgi:SAM-dependent methyltransferase
MVVQDGPLVLGETREALAQEWRETNPATPDAIHRFYRTSERLGQDLDAWHATPERQSWTDMLVHVAKTAGAERIIDIGCGAGHDLTALHEALPSASLYGVEPNAILRDRLGGIALATYPDVAQAPLEMADLLVSIDVLEHVPDPDSFMAGIAQRAPVGCLLFETCPTHDHSTPLHLESNRGWHPGHVLEAYGWRQIDNAEGRVRVWRRVQEVGQQTSSILLCSYRDIAIGSMQAVMSTIEGSEGRWRFRVKNGDALIGRSRGIIVTKWYQETADDVFLMIDSDIGYTPQDADHVVELCRNGYDIVAGAYPVHNGQHLSLRLLPETDEVIQFGPGNSPMEIMYAATGFMAVHRRVIDAMVRELPLTHAYEPWAFYNFFPQSVVEDPYVGGYSLLSEDWGFNHLARSLGFKVWLDRTVKLTHGSTIPVSVNNMGLVFQASQKV